MSGRKKNKHTNLTALSPIEYRADDPDGRIARVRATLEAETHKPLSEQFLRSCPTLHMARLQIIDDILPPMGQQPADSLMSKYLLLVADIDGEVDDFLDALYNGPQYPYDWARGDAEARRHAEFVHNVWGQCIGYPEKTGAVFFRQYIERCRIKVVLPYAAYDHTVGEIVAAKHRQAHFAAFVSRVQGLPAERLFAEWRAYRASERGAIAAHAVQHQDAEDSAEADPDDAGAMLAPRGDAEADRPQADRS